MVFTRPYQGMTTATFVVISEILDSGIRRNDGGGMGPPHSRGHGEALGWVFTP